MTILLIVIFLLSLAVLGVFLYPLFGEVGGLAKDSKQLMERVAEVSESAQEMAPLVDSLQQGVQRVLGQVMVLQQEAAHTFGQVSTVVSSVQGVNKGWRMLMKHVTPETAALILAKKDKLKSVVWERPIALIQSKLLRRKVKKGVWRVIDAVGERFGKRKSRRLWMIPTALLGGGLIGGLFVRRLVDQGPDFYGETY